VIRLGEFSTLGRGWNIEFFNLNRLLFVKFDKRWVGLLFGRFLMIL
jgi:hypothetical protein